jgi:hypothetical protein
MMGFGAEIFRDIVRVIEKDLDLGKVATNSILRVRLPAFTISGFATANPARTILSKQPDRASVRTAGRDFERATLFAARVEAS